VNVDASLIEEHMPVLDADGKEVATVDAVEGDFLKFTKDEVGEHHWIDFSFVERVDDAVHLNVEEEELKSLWVSTSPWEDGEISAGH